MPIYEYQCAACGHQQEYLQRLNDAPQTKCPKCGKKTLKKMVTAAGFQLKGTGWYATDFKHSGSKPAADKSKEKSEKSADAPAKDAPAKEAPAKEKKSDSKSSATVSS